MKASHRRLRTRKSDGRFTVVFLRSQPENRAANGQNPTVGKSRSQHSYYYRGLRRGQSGSLRPRQGRALLGRTGCTDRPVAPFSTSTIEIDSPQPGARRRADAPLHVSNPHQETTMSKMDRGRPRYRREGRQLEDVNGATLPAEFRAPPRARPSREAQRADADAAMRAFIAKGGTVKRQPLAQPTRPAAQARRPATASSVKPPTQTGPAPWED
jgi:hypothetical protein